jgi:hypothetical protein
MIACHLRAKKGFHFERCINPPPAANKRGISVLGSCLMAEGTRTRRLMLLSLNRENVKEKLMAHSRCLCPLWFP